MIQVDQLDGVAFKSSGAIIGFLKLFYFGNLGWTQIVMLTCTSKGPKVQKDNANALLFCYASSKLYKLPRIVPYLKEA